ncbi:Saccharopine dehydrogenase [Mycoemilia scoparia]|uniref:Saccharopine dehydrogenase [NAD(+), L-lysine-forming] n=1 Tax=Mycoemilia scoparia TaxID=417184 RepID=A0A9W7ZZM9_9FUNG|nr:Saccharopine dehydrogenase [Mycoemilia scoparia]
MPISLQSTQPAVKLWLRDETKPMEHRACLSPAVCQELIADGFQIKVERSTVRIFNDAEYEAVGCELVPNGSWREAPLDEIIVGLKELPENETSPLPHTHIMFAHCYKGQDGWRNVLSRFSNGNGLLYDLEFLENEQRKRVAAFGFYAGFAGAAVGISAWCHQQNEQGPHPPIGYYPNEDELIAELKAKIQKAGRNPRIMVIGALGRCGSGAIDLALKAGVPTENILKWDINETKRGGPFQEIIDADIFINCIYLTTRIPPFITKEMCDGERNLSVVVDVSCDPNNPFNPIPIYNASTTFDNPLLTLSTANKEKPLHVCAIDHLPSMLPREASERFALDLLPTLKKLSKRHEAGEWVRAEELFHAKVATIEHPDDGN